MPTIGLDLGGTKLASAVFSDSGALLRREEVFLEGRVEHAVGELMGAHVSSLMRWSEGLGTPVEAVGASVPGIYYARTGRVWAPNVPGWEDYPLLEVLQRAAGAGLTVQVDSDRTCSIFGETWQGVARGMRNAIFLAVGTGIGAGILIDGRVLRGSGDAAGAIGWMALDRPYRQEYDACGCFEYHASGHGLARVAQDELAAAPDYAGPLRTRSPEALTARHIFDALDAGDLLARHVLNNAISFWGMAVANLVSLFNPEMIVFGGGVFGPASAFLGRIRDEALRWAQPVSMRRVRLEASHLGNDAALYGAAYLSRLSLPETD